MKKTFLLMAAIAAMVCSCDKDGDCVPCQREEEQEQKAALRVSLNLEGDPQTKATNYVTAQAYETAVNDVQIFVFDSKGALATYLDADTKTNDITINTIYGEKTVYAVVNGPDLSGITTQEALEHTAVDLGANSTTASKGFVMVGSTTCNVSGTTATVTIAVKRLVARVALQKITNSLPASYGSLTVNNVMLINVAGNQNLECTASISTWYNKMGRKDEATSSSQIIDGTTYLASHPSLTFMSVGKSVANGGSLAPTTPYLFYTYQNNSTSEGSGWTNTFSARKTKLVVTATIGGTKYYYPISINNPQRNTAHAVELTITGLGSSDPDKPVEKGAITATVTVDPWQNGEIYNATI